VQGDCLEFVRTWRRKQLEYVLISNSLQQGRVSFAVITRRALDYTLSQKQIEATERVRQELVAAWDELRLWPEAGHVLTEMKARGYRIGLLSNGDDSMLRALAARLPVPCDDVFSSEQAGCYKPHPSVYGLPLRALRLAAEQILHVAGSPTDVMGAKAAGLRCAWSNRQRDRVLDVRCGADHEFDDLRGLLAVLA
jgi:2-haloacid dehalogenase